MLKLCAHNRNVTLINIVDTESSIECFVRIHKDDFSKTVHDSLIVQYIEHNVSIECDSIQSIFKYQTQFNDQQFRKFVFNVACKEFQTLSVNSTLLFERYIDNQIVVTVESNGQVKGAVLNISDPNCVFDFTK